MRAEFRDGYTLRTTAVAAALFSLAATGCDIAPDGEDIRNIRLDPDEYAMYEEAVRIPKGVIEGGVNIRHDPYVLEPKPGSQETADNSCFLTQLPVKLGELIGQRAERNADSPNGPFVGIPISHLPDDIRRQCSGDADGTVWTIQYGLRDPASGRALQITTAPASGPETV